MDNEEVILDKFRGTLVGLIVGDALGTALEGIFPVVDPIDDMVGGGLHSLQPGQFTDDSTTALLLAESLIETRSFHPEDQLERYLSWYRDGHMSSNGFCFDIGIQTRTAVLRFETTREQYPTDEDNIRSGNGSLMRFCPIVMAFAKKPHDTLLELARNSSRTTHGSRACVDACAAFAALILGAIRGESKETLLSETYLQHFCPNFFDEYPLCEEIDTIMKGSYKEKQPPEIEGSGYVVRTLEAALWAFYTTDDFDTGCLKAVNLGKDSDTVAAVYGQLAGAYYGESSIRKEWRDKIYLNPLIDVIMKELYTLQNINGISIQYPNESKVDLSEEYRNTHQCYMKLEDMFRTVGQKIEPGPKGYTSIDQPKSEWEALKVEYNASMPDCPYKDALVEEFETKILSSSIEDLKKRLNRPKIVLPFA